LESKLIKIGALKPTYGLWDIPDVKDVIKNESCTLCGACIAFCDKAILKDETVSITEKCGYPNCLKCLSTFCPRTRLPLYDIELKIFGRTRKDPYLGNYLMGFSARSKDPKVLEVCQDGGVVTTLLGFALNNGIIDGAVVARREDAPPWKPQPFVARTYEELLEAAGSKYTSSPNLLGLTEAITKYNLKKIAFVGLPCQIQCIRKIQISKQQEASIGRLKLLIGLFCTETFSYTALVKEILEKKYNLRPERIKKFDIKKNRFLIQIEKQEAPVAIRLKEMKQYAYSGCHYCLDFSSELADISVGSVGSPPGWSTVLARTKIGDQIYRALGQSGNIESKPLDMEAALREIVKATEKKQNENFQRIMDRVKKSRKFQFVYSTQPKQDFKIRKSWYLDE